MAMSNCQRVLNREFDWGLEALVGHVSLNYGTCNCLQRVSSHSSNRGVEKSFPLGNYGNYGIGEWLCPKLLYLKMYQNVTVYHRLIETASDIWGVESVDMVRQCLSAVDNDYTLQ